MKVDNINNLFSKNIFVRAVVLILFVILLFNNLSFAQADSTKSVLTGKVISEKNNGIPGSRIILTNSLNGKSVELNTELNGEFKFQVSEGIYNIYVSKEGYSVYEEKGIKLTKSLTRNLKILLLEKLFTTDIIDVEGQFRQSQNDLRTSIFNFSPKNIKILPGAIEDVLRSLKSLPGVSSPNDFTSQLIIRGSGPDQNLIIMDDVEIFNPYRLYGLVSMFNPETLYDITLITGGFPSKYGDRLSAVLDVLNREGTTEKPIAFTANINIASANLIFQGRNPLKIPGSWIISTRRTYYDLILGPFAKKAGLITDDSSFPSFEDLQFKIAFGPFKKHKFFINGIFSKDGVDIIPGKNRSNPDSVNVNDVTKNNVASLSWHYIPNSQFLSKTTLSWYRNNGQNDFEGDILDPLIDRENITPSQRDSLKAIGELLGFSFASTYDFYKYSIGNKSVLNEKNFNLEFGASFDLIRTDITYKLNLDDQFKAFLRSLPNTSALLNDFTINGKNNYRSSFYSQIRLSIGKQFYYQPSVRFDYYSYLKKAYFSPRINFGFIINPLTTLRFATGFYYQSPGYEKLIDGQTFFDLTGNIGENLKAEKSEHFILGLERWINNEWQIKTEAYYKKFANLIVQQKLTGYKYKYYINDPNNTDPNYWKNPLNWTRSPGKISYDSLTTIPVNDGYGYSYGIELSLEKKYMNPRTKFYGWINYSYSIARRERFDETVKPYRFDQRHIVNIVANYKINFWLEFGARWSFASNFPFTPPKGIIPRVVNDSLVVNPFTQKVIFNLDYGTLENKYSDVKPDYHRLDIRLTAYTKFWNADWSFYLDVINVYNRKNVLSYSYTVDSNLKVNRKITGMIPILPTLGLSVRL